MEYSRYGIFCEVVESGSFTKTAEKCGYSQSAISQNIKALENEIGFILLERRKDGLRLTQDGKELLPYIQEIYNREQKLTRKQNEMRDMENSLIRIGTFTSVSRNFLPVYIKAFKEDHPGVTFQMKQGDHNSIPDWIRSGIIDIGFVNSDTVLNLETRDFYMDRLIAVLPENHKFTAKDELTLEDIATEPLIILEDGVPNIPMQAFENIGISPTVAYKIYDDYTIMEMIRQGLGIALMYEHIFTHPAEGLVLRPVKDAPSRTVALGWYNWNTLPYAAKRFSEFLWSKKL